MYKRLFILLICGFMACLSFELSKAAHSSPSVDFSEELNILATQNNFHELSSCPAYISAATSDLCVPRPSTLSGPSRVQSSGKRNLQFNRFCPVLLKGGKSVQPNITSIYNSDFFKFPSGLSENTHHLISLGKLII